MAPRACTNPSKLTLLRCLEPPAGWCRHWIQPEGCSLRHASLAPLPAGALDDEFDAAELGSDADPLDGGETFGSDAGFSGTESEESDPDEDRQTAVPAGLGAAQGRQLHCCRQPLLSADILAVLRSPGCALAASSRPHCEHCLWPWAAPIVLGRTCDAPCSARSRSAPVSEVARQRAADLLDSDEDSSMDSKLPAGGDFGDLGSSDGEGSTEGLCHRHVPVCCRRTLARISGLLGRQSWQWSFHAHCSPSEAAF